MAYTRNMLGAVLVSTSCDAGTRRMFGTAKGEHVKSWGDRAFKHRTEYDGLRRPTHQWMKEGSQTEELVERLVYGEADASASSNNLVGRLVQHYDQSGLLLTDSFDFKGNLASQTRRLAADYQNTVDWVALANIDDPATVLSTATGGSALSAETFVHEFAFDALNRPITATVPDGATVAASTAINAGFNIAGLLEAVSANLHGDTNATEIVTNVDYDEKGRRTLIEYGNGTSTAYTYDALTFRLKTIETTRASDTKTLQKLTYTYDAVGNVVLVKDEMDQSLIFSANTLNPDQEFTYDAVYRLVEGHGREHAAGQTSQYDNQDVTDGHDIPHANNPQGLRNYIQYFAYDAVGNFSSFQHSIVGGGNGEWTRSYSYDSGTNRLHQTSVGNTNITYTHDDHGNMTAMPHLAAMDWDYADQLRHVEVSNGQDVYFVYDGSGQRVRKVYEHSGLIEERIYLGGYEVYRKYTGTDIHTATLNVERQTVHVADDARRVCMVETLTVDSSSAIATPTVRFRYQLDNHLGTSCMETDDAGAIITYEDYHPYGTSAYRAWKTGTEVSAKRYRYTGKERDDETSLYYHGARYYAPWLGRWTAADPMGTVDGTALYNYCTGSPVCLRDPNGTRGEPGGITDQQVADYLRGAQSIAPDATAIGRGGAGGAESGEKQVLGMGGYFPSNPDYIPPAGHRISSEATSGGGATGPGTTPDIYPAIPLEQREQMAHSAVVYGLSLGVALTSLVGAAAVAVAGGIASIKQGIGEVKAGKTEAGAVDITAGVVSTGLGLFGAAVSLRGRAPAPGAARTAAPKVTESMGGEFFDDAIRTPTGQVEVTPEATAQAAKSSGEAAKLAKLTATARALAERGFDVKVRGEAVIGGGELEIGRAGSGDPMIAIESKRLAAGTTRAVQTALSDATKQGPNVVIDATGTGLTQAQFEAGYGTFLRTSLAGRVSGGSPGATHGTIVAMGKGWQGRYTF